MAVYERIGTDAGQPAPEPAGPEAYDRGNFHVGTPNEVIERLRRFREVAPVTEVCFWHRLPGVPHEAAVANLERLARDVLPAFR
jgi:alkanesulfonate monooxygenase SsuD/methylene tetrahydromethanopterin reductase-like flavin-dependent oxidoreductase (luciferase family)